MTDTHVRPQRGTTRLMALAAALAAAKAAHENLRPRPGVYAVARRQSAEHVHRCWIAAHRVRAETLGAWIDLDAPLMHPGKNARYPGFLDQIRQQNWEPRLLDHEVWLRLARSRGAATARDTVVITEPYISAVDVPSTVAVWTGMLAPLGLVVRPLPWSWRLHAPANPAAQVFIIASPELIARSGRVDRPKQPHEGVARARGAVWG